MHFILLDSLVDKTLARRLAFSYTKYFSSHFLLFLKNVVQQLISIKWPEKANDSLMEFSDGELPNLMTLAKDV